MEPAIQLNPIYDFKDLKLILQTLVHKYSLNQPRSHLNTYSKIVLAGPYRLPDKSADLLNVIEDFLSRTIHHKVLIAMVSYNEAYQVLYLHNEESRYVLYHYLPQDLIEIIDMTRYYAIPKIFEDIKLELSQGGIPIIVQLSNIEEICSSIAQDTSIDHASIRQYMERRHIDESQILELSNLYNSYIRAATRAIDTSIELPRLSFANLQIDEMRQKIVIKPSDSVSMTLGLLNKYLDYSMYVDKTMFIKNVLTAIHLCIIVTRPPKWGKSVNLQTLRLFLSSDLIERKRILRDGFIRKSKLAQSFPSYINHMGKYPVIYLDLSSSSTLDLMGYKELFKQQLIKSYYQHSRSIMNSEYASEEIIEALGNKLENIDIESALIMLAECLKAEYERDVYLLIDGADSHLVTMLNEGYSKESISELAKIKSFTNHVLSKIHDTDIFRVVMTGVYGSYFKDYPIQSCQISRLDYPESFTEDFGFTENEVESLLKEILEECYIGKFLTCMKYWYNGYNLKKNESELIKIYSPYSTLDFLYKLSKDSTSKPSSSKNNSQSPINATFEKYIQESKNLEILDRIIRISTYTSTHASFQGVIGDISVGRLGYLNCDSILQMLHDLGYFTIRDDDRMIIPNLDAKTYIDKKVIYPWLQYKCKLKDPEGTAKSLANVLKSTQSFIRSVSKIKVFHKRRFNEITYSAIIFTLIELARYLKITDHVYEGMMEAYTKDFKGRLDSIFIPMSWDNTAIIHEYGIKKSRLYHVNAKKKLRQILEKGYLGVLMSEIDKYPHIKFVICRAIIINKDPFKVYGYSFKFTIEESIKLLSDFNKYDAGHLLIEETITNILGKEYTPEVAECSSNEDLKRAAPDTSSEKCAKKMKL